MILRMADLPEKAVQYHTIRQICLIISGYVRGAENTKKSYLNSVTGLARHYRRSPEQISAQEVQDYLVHLHEQRGLSWKVSEVATNRCRRK